MVSEQKFYQRLHTERTLPKFVFTNIWEVLKCYYSFHYLAHFQKSFIPWSHFTCEFSHGSSKGALTIKPSVLHFFQCKLQACWRDKINEYLPTAAMISVCLTTRTLMGRERGPQLHLAVQSQVLKLKTEKVFVISFPFWVRQTENKSPIFSAWGHCASCIFPLVYLSRDG